MSCAGCSSSSGDGRIPKGCGNNGSCGTGSCSKLQVFDWLSNMSPAIKGEEFKWIEVRFKNTRKEFYYNQHALPLQTGDAVAVEGSPGHDIGVISMVGELVRVQMKRLKFKNNPEDKKNIFRKARENDITRWKEAIAKENDYMLFCRKTAKDLKLEMKVTDVECQGDGSKATFFYTAEGRVDFRELIKILARDLKVRIEMRQIGFRQEAGRIGGIGVCGRELCCSSWMRDFRSVTTAAARYQQLSINPQKLAGQCGKLKCCLNYELDSYMDALRDFPDVHIRLKTRNGDAIHQKTDIFGQTIYYSYENAPGILIPVPLQKVKEIIQKNKSGEIIENLDVQIEKPKQEKTGFSNVIQEDSLTRFDKQKRNKNRNRKNPSNKSNKPRKPKPKANE